MRPAVSDVVSERPAPAASPDAPVITRLSFLDRFLPLWIILAMAVGIGLGRAVPSLNRHLNAIHVTSGTSLPIFVGLQSVPKIAIAPLILVWVGAGLGSKILVVASITFFPIVINSMAGFKEVDRGLADVFDSVAATERQMFMKLRLPYAMPYIFAGLRIATTLAVLGAIVAEWLAASNGLGYLVLSGSFNFNTARSFAAIIALAIIGTAFFNLMSWIERLVSWRTDINDSTVQV